MVGWLTVEERKGWQVTLERTALAGLPLLRAEVPLLPGAREKTRVRRVRKTAALLARSGVRRVLTPPEFPRWDLLGEYGLRPVDPEPLCQALAAPLVLAELERQRVPPSAGAAVLSGRRVSRPLFQAALTLCPQVRALVIDVPSGGAELAQELRREFGAAVVTDPGALPVHVRAYFSAGAGRAGELCLWGPVPDLAGFRLEAPGLALSERIETLPFLALLWEEGRISAKDIQIIPADFGKTPFQDQYKNSVNFTKQS